MRRGVQAQSARENFETTPTFGGKSRLFSCIYKGECTSCWSLLVSRARPTNVKKGAERSDGRSGYSCQKSVAQWNAIITELLTFLCVT